MPWCPPVPDLRPLKPWFLISHNLEHRLLEQDNALHRCFAAWMRRVEFEAPKVYDDIFTCSEEDHDFFRRHDPSQRLKLPIVRCGVDPDEYAVSQNTRERIRAGLGLADCDRVLAFSGSGFGPNVEALEWLRTFCHTERDFLRRERLKFLIVGSVAPTRLPRRGVDFGWQGTRCRSLPCGIRRRFKSCYARLRCKHKTLSVSCFAIARNFNLFRSARYKIAAQ